MISIILAVAVQVSALGTEEQDFDQAYHQSLTTGRPLVVLVGARWCPACQKMKNSILAEVAGDGGLKRVVFSYLDFDQQRQLASRLSRGKSIPQLIRFDQTPTGWKSKRLIGARSPRVVYDFVNAGLVDQDKVSKVSGTERPTDPCRKPARAQSVDAPSAASQSKARSLVVATGGRQSDVDHSPVEKAGGSSYWIVLLKRFLPAGGNR
jgi:thiol-disulfide isomerase/thioredoxin